MPRILVQNEPFDIGAETARLLAGAEACGGLGSFLGVVRGGNGLVALTLEHYPGMTEATLEACAEAAMQRFSLLDCTIIHRIGRLEVGAPIVLVLASAPHRAAAMDATRFMIDRLKTGAPFWKCEEFADGRTAWVEARETDDHAAASWDAG